jgi:hypothetical protein
VSNGQVPCTALTSEPQEVHACPLLTNIFSVTGPTDSAHATILTVEIGEFPVKSARLCPRCGPEILFEQGESRPEGVRSLVVPQHVAVLSRADYGRREIAQIILTVEMSKCSERARWRLRFCVEESALTYPAKH